MITHVRSTQTIVSWIYLDYIDSIANVYISPTGAEANLDVQYMIALAQNVPMTYYYDAAADSFLDWITAIANEANPILINSVSYGSTESAL